jgi:WD40 repeat protein
VLTDHTDGVVWCVYSPLGTYLASCSMDGTAIVYDASSLAIRSRLIGHTGGVRALCFSADGTHHFRRQLLRTFLRCGGFTV